jgi:2-polyprenyl-3-methyl-5-hydroxy-6-metoxy-1,4-benzoquinol methylase
MSLPKNPFARRPEAVIPPTVALAEASELPNGDGPSLQDQLPELLSLTNAEGHPNINALTELLRDFNAMKFNMKFFGYELAKTLAAALPPLPSGGPFEIHIESKPSTQADLEANWTRHWSSELGIAHVLHRKIWELAYVLQVIWQTGNMQPGRRGLGFGCGEEPLPSYLASKGCAVTVTDLEPTDERAAGWVASEQHASADRAFRSEFLDRARFDELVDSRYVDMTAIPDTLRDYDFCWSICAFEHLGSIEAGINFIDKAVDVLKPGGVSIHTTEFNFMNDRETVDNWSTVLFQRQHFKEMARRLEAKGCVVAPLNYDVGSKPLDKFIDVAPYGHDWTFDQADKWRVDSNHIKLTADGIPVTCFGIVAIKK